MAQHTAIEYLIVYGNLVLQLTVRIFVKYVVCRTCIKQLTVFQVLFYSKLKLTIASHLTHHASSWGAWEGIHHAALAYTDH